MGRRAGVSWLSRSKGRRRRWSRLRVDAAVFSPVPARRVVFISASLRLCFAFASVHCRFPVFASHRPPPRRWSRQTTAARRSSSFCLLLAAPRPRSFPADRVPLVRPIPWLPACLRAYGFGLRPKTPLVRSPARSRLVRMPRSAMCRPWPRSSSRERWPLCYVDLISNRLSHQHWQSSISKLAGLSRDCRRDRLARLLPRCGKVEHHGVVRVDETMLFDSVLAILAEPAMDDRAETLSFLPYRNPPS